MEIFILQSPLICVRCPSYRGVHFIESFSVGNPTKNSRDQNKRLSQKGVRLIEMSVKRELTVIIIIIYER